MATNTRAQLRAAVLRELNPGKDSFVSDTATSHGTATTVVCSRLTSFRRTKSFYQGKQLYIPGAAAADQTRIINDFDPDNGTVTLDRAVSGTPVTVSGTAFEIFPTFDVGRIHRTINRTLRNCEYVSRVKLYGVSGTTFYDLTTATRNLIIDATNKNLDFQEVSTEYNEVLTEDEYDADDLATHIQTVMNDTSGISNTYTVTFSRTTGKFTIARDTGSAAIALLWKTGTNGYDNTLTNPGTVMGFTVAADDSGATTYTSDSAVDTNTWIEESRQVGRSRWHWSGGFGDILTPRQMGLHEHNKHVETYVRTQLYSSSHSLWVPTLRPFRELTAETHVTTANIDMVVAGTLRYLYLALVADESAGHAEQYTDLLEFWTGEFGVQTRLHQGRLPRQTYGEVA